MKNVVYLLLAVFVIVSCSKDDEQDVNEIFPQKWQLISMYGGKITGSNMGWQEYYIFNADSTFIKHREREGVITEAIGTFTREKKSTGTYFYLVSNDKSLIISSCAWDFKTEELWLRSNIMQNSWIMCDGTGFEYEMVKEQSGN